MLRRIYHETLWMIEWAFVRLCWPFAYLMRTSRHRLWKRLQRN